MDKVGLDKALQDRISRSFNLAFNQILMYGVGHKSGAQSLERFGEAVAEGLEAMGSLAVSLNKDQFYLEDEPFDARINSSRLAQHFKKTDTQSISFEKGVSLQDLVRFFEVFTDLNNYPDADAVKKALDNKGLTRIRINYIIYKKITTDEDVILKRQLEGGSLNGDGGIPTAADILGFMAANIISEEIGISLPLDVAVGSQAELSERLIHADLTAAEQSEGQALQPGATLMAGLKNLNRKVDSVLASGQRETFAELAEGVFELKKKLLQGIEDQKSKGVVYLDEKNIRQETDDMTDAVLIRLISTEYAKGTVDIHRLALIIARMVPETAELQRLLPKLKTALLNEGMPLNDYLELVRELKNELQSEELARVLERSAEDIGLDGEELIASVMKNPKEAAELIYLAAEIRQGNREGPQLSDILVEYVERIGSTVGQKASEKNPAAAETQYKGLFSNLRAELVGKMKGRGMDADTLSRMEQRLTARIETSIRQLQANLALKSADKSAEEAAEKGATENSPPAAAEETEKAPSKKLPAGTLKRNTALFVIENEIRRSMRYDTPFSILSFSIVQAQPKAPAPPTDVAAEDIVHAVMQELADICRETDLICHMGQQVIMVLQPMTPAANSKKGLERVIKAFKARTFKVKETPFDIQVAGVSTPFEGERMADLNVLLQQAQNDLKGLMTRLTNIRNLM